MMTPRSRRHRMTDEQTARPEAARDQEAHGRILALEMMVTQLAWEWAMTQPQPQASLARWMRPVEETIAQMSAEPANNQHAMQAARSTAKGIFEWIEQRLHSEALHRSQQKGPGN